MMDTYQIIDLLKQREIEFLKTKTFSQLPGIYAFFFIGDKFPILGESVSRHQIIYIGKTESSQEKRDAKTHFSSGKTGSSTVRRSVGALLLNQKNLKPIPRNNSDAEKGRLSHYKFDEKSERIITEWMENNLALAFFEYPKSKREIEDLETAIIQELVPILNISKNSNNPFKADLQKLRKNCATIALRGADSTGTIIQKPKTQKMETNQKYSGAVSTGGIYISNITAKDAKSKKIRITVDNKHLFPQERRGESNTYDLDFVVGDSEFKASYTIGSKDGRSRSGVLKLGNYVYQEVLKIQEGTMLKISKINGGKYMISK